MCRTPKFTSMHGHKFGPMHFGRGHGYPFPPFVGLIIGFMVLGFLFKSGLFLPLLLVGGALFWLVKSGAISRDTFNGWGWDMSDDEPGKPKNDEKRKRDDHQDNVPTYV